MSSRTKADPKNPLDFFATPDWASDIILPHLRVPTTILEPCAGDGAMMKRFAKFWPHADIRGLEIDPVRAETAVVGSGDFLTYDVRGSYDLIATNPPFSLAEAIVRRALALVRPGGEVAMLLRLAFAESFDRTEFHKANPSMIHIFNLRPSFTDGTSTDSAAYAWFVWGPGRANRWELLEKPESAKKKRGVKA